MADSSSAASTLAAAESTSPQMNKSVAAVTNKLFVSGLGIEDTKNDIRELFCSYRDVLEVVVDGTYATVTYTEWSVQEVVQIGEIMLKSPGSWRSTRKLPTAMLLSTKQELYQHPHQHLSSSTSTSLLSLY